MSNEQFLVLLAAAAVGLWLWYKNQNHPLAAVTAVKFSTPPIGALPGENIPGQLTVSPALAPATTNANWPLWLVIGLLAFMLLRHQIAPAKPSSTGVLGPAFSTTDDRAQAQRDARIFATICVSLADAIEYDSTLSSPRIKSGVQVDDLRRAVREYRLKGSSLSVRYPGLPTAVDSFLTARVGTHGGPLDNDQRKKWVVAFRDLSAAADEVAR